MKYTLTLLYRNKPCGSMEFATAAMAEWMRSEFTRRFRGDGFSVTLEPEPTKAHRLEIACATRS